MDLTPPKFVTELKIMKLRIAVVDGGFSSEDQISYLSADTVMAKLDSSLYEPHRIRINKDGWTYDPTHLKLAVDKNDFSVILDGERLHFDCAMIVIHGTPGEDGKLQAYFDLLNIPYTTCNQLTSTLTFNKFYCNRVLESYGFKCARAMLLRTPDDYNDEQIIASLSLPCFVKPNDGGSSFGASRVNEEKQLRPAIKQAFEHGKEVIVEEFMPGQEVTNGVYFNGQEVHPLPITEIVSKNEFFDFEAKYKGESEEITPARISNELTAEIKATSKAIYEKMGLAGVCRIDYIIKNGVPHVIEINTVPGQSAESIIPKMAACDGIELSDLFYDLIKNAMS